MHELLILTRILDSACLEVGIVDPKRSWNESSLFRLALVIMLMFIHFISFLGPRLWFLQLQLTVVYCDIL